MQHVDRLVFTNDDGQAHAEELQRQIHEPRLMADTVDPSRFRATVEGLPDHHPRRGQQIRRPAGR